MMRALLLLCFLSLEPLVLCDNYDDETTSQYVAKFKNAFAQANLADADVQLRDTAALVDYACELDVDPPTSVHDLSSRYVDVVAAMGDSITAAMGANASTIFTDLFEYRGQSWSIGGDKTLKEEITLPNILRTFNDDVIGFSTGVGSSNARLNVAVSGAVASDMVGQAEKLVEKMALMGVTDEHWKVITIWIGANDLCAKITCSRNNATQNAEIYIKEVEKALDILKRDVKRAFVNLVGMIDISEIAQIEGPFCGLVHWAVCDCGSKAENRELVKESARLYNVQINELLEKGEYDTDDFTAVYQPFFSKTVVPLDTNGNPDKSFFAPDCFHFSTKGHRIGATYLWKNMFEPVKAKSDQIDWNSSNDIACPKDNPYFATKRNIPPASSSLNSNEQNHRSNRNLVAILLGAGVGVAFVAIVAVIVSVGVIRQRRVQPENMPLFSVKNF